MFMLSPPSNHNFLKILQQQNPSDGVQHSGEMDSFGHVLPQVSCGPGVHFQGGTGTNDCVVQV